MSDIKLCKDCRLFEEAGPTVSATCGHTATQLVDYVRGENVHTHCYIARRLACGPAGVWWEPRP